MPNTYNLDRIHNLLNDAFASGEALLVFCYDQPAFRTVYVDLTQTASRADLTHHLLTYAHHNRQLEHLLDLVQAIAPEAHVLHSPYHHDPAADPATAHPHLGHRTIDRLEVIDQFGRLMQTDSSHRLLRLVGEAKMGKSHLLTKVFPEMARRWYLAGCAIIDLRSYRAPADILLAACSQLDPDRFPAFHQAYQVWLDRPRPLAEATSLEALLAQRGHAQSPSDQDDR